ncbi:ABC transporter ATP-binding protein [Elusimicrobiota bacterium]
MTILTVNNITKDFELERGFFQKKTGFVRALDDVSFKLDSGEIIGIIGESGSGKTTLGKIICKLIEPDSGTIYIEEKNLKKFNRKELSDKVQMIFQNPFASLNPKLTVGTMLFEAVLGLSRAEKKKRIRENLKVVGLSDAILPSYPHQFSGGQRQRIAIARALMKKPEVIVADEPLSSLDVTIQNQLLSLFKKLKDEYSVSLIYISHDLVSTANIADTILVMKEGKIVESGKSEKILRSPNQSYTRNLISSVPQVKGIKIRR